MKSTIVALWGALLVCAPVHAQTKVLVGVSVADSSGSIASVVRATLRSIPDVEVVSTGEASDVRLSFVALCIGDRCSQRAVSFVLSVPLTANEFRIATRSAPTAAELANYEDVVGQWVFVWGEARYESAVRSLIRAIDDACFEVVRNVRRATVLMATGDTATANTLLRLVRPSHLSSRYSC